MANSENLIPADKMALYARLIDLHSELEIKGKKSAYTSTNTYMQSFMTEAGTLCLRMSKAEIEAFMAEFDTQMPVQHGATMKDFVEVPNALLENTEAAFKYLEMSFHHTSSLKPKPSKKKKAK